MNELPDNALVVRGGLNLPDMFENGSGVTQDSAGKLYGVSVNCAPGKGIGELAHSLRNRRIDMITVGKIRAAGGEVTPMPTKFNPDHCALSGLDAQTASALFTPTLAHPRDQKILLF